MTLYELYLISMDCANDGNYEMMILSKEDFDKELSEKEN